MVLTECLLRHPVYAYRGSWDLRVPVGFCASLWTQVLMVHWIDTPRRHCLSSKLFLKARDILPLPSKSTNIIGNGHIYKVLPSLCKLLSSPQLKGIFQQEEGRVDVANSNFLYFPINFVNSPNIFYHNGIKGKKTQQHTLLSLKSMTLLKKKTETELPTYWNREKGKWEILWGNIWH